LEINAAIPTVLKATAAARFCSKLISALRRRNKVNNLVG